MATIGAKQNLVLRTPVFDISGAPEGVILVTVYEGRETGVCLTPAEAERYAVQMIQLAAHVRMAQQQAALSVPRGMKKEKPAVVAEPSKPEAIEPK